LWYYLSVIFLNKNKKLLKMKILKKRKNATSKLIFVAAILGGFLLLSKNAQATCFPTFMSWVVCTNVPGPPDVSGNSVTFYYSTSVGSDSNTNGIVAISPVADFSSGVQTLCELPGINSTITNQSGTCNGVPSGTWYWRFSNFYDDFFDVGADSAGVFTVSPLPPGESWLWGGSDNGFGNNTGVGWISMKNTNAGAGGSIGYEVNIPSAGGNLSGYAWSENIGWISFEPADLVGCPSGTCTARRVGNDLKGWARIMSIAQAIGGGSYTYTSVGEDLLSQATTMYGPSVPSCDCDQYNYSEDCGGFPSYSTFTSATDQGDFCYDYIQADPDPIIRAFSKSGSPIPSNSGGWQGWIKLGSETGDPVVYGITFNADGTVTKGAATSYAWSDELGWIDFSRSVSTASACNPSENPTFTPGSCVSGSACGACGQTETTNPWACVGTDKCGGYAIGPQADCTGHVPPITCSDTHCPACPAHKSGNWREVAP